MGKWNDINGVRIWLNDEGKPVVWVHCDACPPTPEWPGGIPAYYEKDEENGVSTWCWRHAPDDAKPIPVECRCESCREWKQERKKR